MQKYLLLIPAFCAMMVVACSKQDNAVPVANQTAFAVTGNCSGSAPGAITSNFAAQDMFQQAMQILANVTNLGIVSGISNDPNGTGVRFTGCVNFNSPLSSATINSQLNAVSGSVTVSIYDSNYVSGTRSAPINVNMNIVPGSLMLAGGNAYLRFQNGNAFVEFDGQIYQDGSYQGNFYCQNGATQCVDGLAFNIPACAFMKCN